MGGIEGEGDALWEGIADEVTRSDSGGWGQMKRQTNKGMPGKTVESDGYVQKEDRRRRRVK